MNANAVLQLLRDTLSSGDGTLFWFSASLLLLALALIAQRRSKLAHARAQRARKEAEKEDLGGTSYFMPLPEIEQAVEIANPVDIEHLLSGQPDAVAEQARAQLEASTDVLLEQPAHDEPLIAIHLGPEAIHPVAAPRMPSVAAPVTLAAVPALAPVNITSLPARHDSPVEASIEEQITIRGTTPQRAENAVPVRDLVLAWFEARGYRSSSVSVQFRPIELQLKHRNEPDRGYAFAVERDRVTGLRATALLKIAKAAGQNRLLIASEAGCDPAVAKELRHQGVRVFDNDAIRAELEKIDLSVAAKIIAVARSRDEARQTALQGHPLAAVGT